MINTIEIEIPYPIKMGFLSINRKKIIKMRFDNLSKFLFMENNNLSKNADFEKFRKENENSVFLAECVWAAVQSQYVKDVKRLDIDKGKFLAGFANCGKKQINEVVKVWARSQELGAERMPGKKKVVRH